MGGAGGGGFLNSVPVSGGIGSATAGFQTGATLGGYIGYSQNRHIGGELRYAYLQSNLSLKSGGAEASFSGISHVVHYDLIFKTTRNSGKVQLFAAVGGGELRYAYLQSNLSLKSGGAEASFSGISHVVHY